MILDHTERFDTKDYHLNPDSKIGCYLIHGFTSTTYEVRDLAHLLAANGYRVVAENLPGHGTTVDDCNRVKYTDWLTHTEQGFAKLYSECDSVFVGGVSMGSLLAINLSQMFPVAGLITAAPLIEFLHRLKTKYLNPFMCMFISKLTKGGRYPKNVRDTYKFYGYNYYPMRAINQVQKMTDLVRENIHKIKSPILIQFAENDVTLPPSNAKIIRDSVSSENIWYSGYKKTTHNMWDNDLEKDVIHQEVLHFMNSISGMDK